MCFNQVLWACPDSVSSQIATHAATTFESPRREQERCDCLLLASLAGPDSARRHDVYDIHAHPMNPASIGGSAGNGPAEGMTGVAGDRGPLASSGDFCEGIAKALLQVLESQPARERGI